MSRLIQTFSRDDDRWQSGIARAAATLGLTPEQVTAQTGLTFAAGLDHLDYFRAVGIELPSGRSVLLIWHERSPKPSLEIRIDSSDDPVAARAETLSVLGLSHEHLAWVPPS